MSAVRRRLESQYGRFHWRNDPANTYLSQDIIIRLRAAARLACNGRLDARILDVGCGSGRVIGELRDELGASIAVGMDLLPRFELSTGVVFVSGDAQRLPFASATFDLTTLMTVLSSIRDDAARGAVLAECLRVTRPGGTVLVYDFVLKNPMNRYTRAVSARRIRNALEGAATVDSQRVTLNPLIARLVFATRLRWANLLCDYLAKVPLLRHHVLVRAVKR